MSISLEKRKLLETYAKTYMSAREIAEKLGISKNTVLCKFRAFGGRSFYDAEKDHEHVMSRRLSFVKLYTKDNPQPVSGLQRIVALEMQMEILFEEIKSIKEKL